MIHLRIIIAVRPTLGEPGGFHIGGADMNKWTKLDIATKTDIIAYTILGITGAMLVFNGIGCALILMGAY